VTDRIGALAAAFGGTVPVGCLGRARQPPPAGIRPGPRRPATGGLGCLFFGSLWARTETDGCLSANCMANCPYSDNGVRQLPCLTSVRPYRPPC
jgi:hypothetical protein